MEWDVIVYQLGGVKLMVTKIVRVKIPKYRVSSTGKVRKVGTTTKTVKIKTR